MPAVIQVALESWGASAWVTLALAITALIYLRGWLRLRSTSLNVIALWRAASFLLGLFSIWVAVASPITAFDEQLLTVHMVQHLLLMTFAPPLIWLGAPVMPLLHGLPRRVVQRVIGPVFRWPPAQRLGGKLAQPAFCWLAAIAALVGWHFPPAFMLALHSEAWHAVEHASFLGTGLLFWWPVIQPWPSVAKWPGLSIVLYLFLATLPCDILSGFLVFCDRVVYPAYFSASRPFGLSALEDQQCAGALMWTCVTVVYLVAGAILTTRLLSPQTSSEDLFVPSPTPANGTPEGVPQSLEVI
jgi:cytochrome c oxidase assembly factor CtaG